ncbi:MAG: SAM-dependent methyltransferase [Deltaproteobacteria bacterium]|nr:SAM-dependent methyltransferase [Deltaproteobacteria bacterium]
MPSPADGRVPGSFRDPSGFLFRHQGRVYRHVGPRYAEDYALLMDSGLHAALVADGDLVDHEEVDDLIAPDASPPFRTLLPEQIDTLSWPYEWCFGQLGDAALLTLRVHRKALEHGMCLKDASAYNVQFRHGRPVLIDTLSFARWDTDAPWVAYQQFCKHFLAPLALMAKVDIRLAGLLRVHIDGIPLDLASRLLPWGTRLSPGLAAHLHLHARAQRTWGDAAGEGKPPPKPSFSHNAMIGLVGSLEKAVRGLRWEPSGTEWADYYARTSYDDEALQHKTDLVAALIDEVGPTSAWDLGANDGRFSRLAVERGASTVAWDLDPAAVERCWRGCREERIDLLPLVLDLTNPSPGLGWAHTERASLQDRGPVDLVMALALVHHLAIGNNVPLDRIAAWLVRLGGSLIVEFVPKSDPQVRRMLATREDVFPDYTWEGFEAAFSRHATIARREPVPGTERSLYLLRAGVPREVRDTSIGS